MVAPAEGAAPSAEGAAPGGEQAGGGDEPDRDRDGGTDGDDERAGRVNEHEVVEQEGADRRPDGSRDPEGNGHRDHGQQVRGGCVGDPEPVLQEGDHQRGRGERDDRRAHHRIDCVALVVGGVGMMKPSMTRTWSPDQSPRGARFTMG